MDSCSDLFFFLASNVLFVFVLFCLFNVVFPFAYRKRPKWKNFKTPFSLFAKTDVTSHCSCPLWIEVHYECIQTIKAAALSAAISYLIMCLPFKFTLFALVHKHWKIMHTVLYTTISNANWEIDMKRGLIL